MKRLSILFFILTYTMVAVGQIYPIGSRTNTVQAQNNLQSIGWLAPGFFSDTPTQSLALIPIGAFIVRAADSVVYRFTGRTTPNTQHWIPVGGLGFVTTISVNGGPFQSGNVSITIPTNNNQLTNGANYITAAQAPVLSVNGVGGAVVIDGSETKLVDGTNIHVTGLGTIQSPYVINNTAGGGGGGSSDADSIRGSPVDTTGKAQNYVLSFDTTGTAAGGPGKWKVKSVATTYAALTDVQLTSLANNQIVQWNSSLSKWVNITAPWLTTISGITAGGDLSGTYPNPTVAKLNGLAASYYLDYNNLVNKPTSNTPTGPAGGDLSGTYPNPGVAKFNGQLPAYYLNFTNLTNVPGFLPLNWASNQTINGNGNGLIIGQNSYTIWSQSTLRESGIMNGQGLSMKDSTAPGIIGGTIFQYPSKAGYYLMGAGTSSVGHGMHISTDSLAMWDDVSGNAMYFFSNGQAKFQNHVLITTESTGDSSNNAASTAWGKRNLINYPTFTQFNDSIGLIDSLRASRPLYFVHGTKDTLKVKNDSAAWNAYKIMGIPINAAAPTDQQSLVYDVASGTWKPITITAGVGVTNISVTAAPTNLSIVSSTGTPGTFPLSTSTNAGAESPANNVKLNTLSHFANATAAGSPLAYGVASPDSVVFRRLLMTNSGGILIDSSGSYQQQLKIALKFDTTFADFQTYVANHASSGGSFITQLHGDGAATGPGNAVFTLTAVNSNVGAFGSASSVPVFTTNAKGLTTAVTNTPILITESQTTNLVTDLAAKLAAALPSTQLFVGNVSNQATAGGADLTYNNTSKVVCVGCSVAANTAAINGGGTTGTFTIASLGPKMIVGGPEVDLQANVGSGNSVHIRTNSTDRMTFDNSGVIAFTGLTTNGFLQTGSGNGTVSVTSTIPGGSVSGNIPGLAAGLTANIAESQVTNLTTDLAARALLASPIFTGVPTVPTATGGTNTQQIASTQFVQSAIGGLGIQQVLTNGSSTSVDNTINLNSHQLNFTNVGLMTIPGHLRYTDGNQAAGNIMTSDASGNAAWAVPVAYSAGTYGPFQYSGQAVSTIGPITYMKVGQVVVVDGAFGITPAGGAGEYDVELSVPLNMSHAFTGTGDVVGSTSDYNMLNTNGGPGVVTADLVHARATGSVSIRIIFNDANSHLIYYHYRYFLN